MMTEDITAFFDTGAFAQTVSIAGVDVPAIFDSAYSRSQIGIGMASSGPALRLATANVPASAIGAAAIVDGTSYVVVEHQPDGTGVSQLLLETA